MFIQKEYKQLQLSEISLCAIIRLQLGSGSSSFKCQFCSWQQFGIRARRLLLRLRYAFQFFLCQGSYFRCQNENLVRVSMHKLVRGLVFVNPLWLQFFISLFNDLCKKYLVIIECGQRCTQYDGNFQKVNQQHVNFQGVNLTLITLNGANLLS